MARFRAADLVVETKPDLTPVTEADRAVEEMLRSRLAEKTEESREPAADPTTDVPAEEPQGDDEARSDA